MPYLGLFCASVSKVCPRVIVSLLYTMLAHQRLHEDALFSDSRGNLYFMVSEHLHTNYLIFNNSNNSIRHLKSGKSFFKQDFQHKINSF